MRQCTVSFSSCIQSALNDNFPTSWVAVVNAALFSWTCVHKSAVYGAAGHVDGVEALKHKSTAAMETTQPETLVTYLGRDKTSLLSWYYITKRCTYGISLTQILSVSLFSFHLPLCSYISWLRRYITLKRRLCFVDILYSIVGNSFVGTSCSSVTSDGISFQCTRCRTVMIRPVFVTHQVIFFV